MEKEVTIGFKQIEEVELNYNEGTITQGDTTLTLKELLENLLDKSITSVNCSGDLKDYRGLKLQDYDNAYYLGNEENPYIILLSAKSTDITSCKINSNTKIINAHALSSCVNITSITIPNSVTSIGGFAFSRCSSLKYNEYDNGYYLGSEENPYLVFIKAKSKDITTCDIHSNTRFLYDGAFFDCDSLASVVIPPSVTRIGDSAFFGCDRLVEIYNLSSLNINKGSRSNGDIGRYAKVIHTSLEEESNFITMDGFVFIKDNDNKYYLVNYIGTATNLVLPNGIEGNSYAINRYAFYKCNNLISVVIPPSVTSIGVRVFYDCGNLTNIAIPNSVTSIGDSAFEGCVNLTSITIPNSVTRIGEDAFEYCYKLVEIYNLSSLNINKGSRSNGDIGYYAKVIHTSLEVQSSFITKDDFLFIKDNENKYYLVGYNGSETDLVLPNDIEGNNYEINRGVFYKCSSLTRITIPNGVTSIGYAAFHRCSSLTSIIIPKSVTSIEHFVFSKCSSLKSVTIGTSVTSFGGFAFSECCSLKYNEYDNGYYLGSEENPYLVFIKAKTKDITTCEIHSNTRFLHGGAFGDCNRLASVVIPNGVTSIGDCAFNECSSLTSVVIPNGVTSIGDCAFSGCSSLKSVSIPAGITDIGVYFFHNCRSLTNITMPKSVTSIEVAAFQRCDMLKEIFFKGTFVDWSRIEIYEPNKELASITIYYYSKQKPTKRGNYWHYVDGVPTKWELTIK